MELAPRNPRPLLALWVRRDGGGKCERGKEAARAQRVQWARFVRPRYPIAPGLGLLILG